MTPADHVIDSNPPKRPAIPFSHRLRLKVSAWAMKKLLRYFPSDAALMARLGATELLLGNLDEAARILQLSREIVSGQRIVGIPTKTTLTIVNDIRVVVPDSLNLITSYVLREQNDWFEDEIKFVRLLLKPHDKAIDIGANYGIYTLSMAKVVGLEGKIWAFEPATSTAAYLTESIGINEFAQITLDRRALSANAGTAQLALNDHSELNQLIRDGNARDKSETVTVTTLDDAMLEYAWNDIEFIKIDAEGEEEAIIRGGRSFFQTLSPLVQYEIKMDSNVRLELVRAFKDIGYSSYRLVPGLGVLVPFDPLGEADPYLLNLFCCKPDRADRIAADGRLVQSGIAGAERVAMLAEDLLRCRNADLAYNWQNVLTKLPYGNLLAPGWHETVSQGQSIEVEKALALHAMANDVCLPLPERVLALRASFDILNVVCNVQPSFLRYATLARVARDHGTRIVAVNALEKLGPIVKKTHLDVCIKEPFLAPSKYFESVDPNNAIGNWVIGSTMEELERNAYFSSFYSDSSAMTRLKVIRDCGFGSAEMARRLQLVSKRLFNGG